MRFESTKHDLIAEARAALAAADRELRTTSRSHVAQRRSTPPSPTPASLAEGQLEERKQMIDAIANELTAIDNTALDRARDDMQAAIDRFVTASTVYNRILDEMRQQLREAGGLSEEDLSYRSESGHPGLRVRGIVRLQAQPWQTVSQTALHSLRSHAPMDHAPFENGVSSHELDLDGPQRLAPPLLDSSFTPEAHPQPQPVETDPALDREQVEELFGEMVAPVLAFVRDQQVEITQLRTRLEQQSSDIAALREQLERHTASAERINAWFDALREAQARLP